MSKRESPAKIMVENPPPNQGSTEVNHGKAQRAANPPATKAQVKVKPTEPRLHTCGANGRDRDCWHPFRHCTTQLP